jgi:hypothetical protein
LVALRGIANIFNSFVRMIKRDTPENLSPLAYFPAIDEEER